MRHTIISSPTLIGAGWRFFFPFLWRVQEKLLSLQANCKKQGMTAKRDRQKQNRSQLYRQIEEAEAETSRKEEIGKLLLWKSRLITNVGNLVFAGVIVGGVFEEIEYPLIVYGSSTLVAMSSYLIGYNLYKRGIKLWKK